MKLSPPAALVFDLDGTLWDSTEACFTAWTEVLAAVPGLPAPITRDQVRSVFGLKHDLIGDRLLPFLEPVERHRVLTACEQRECEVICRQGGALYPGVEATLEALTSRYRLLLVSNCQDGYIEAFYAYHGLGRYFEDYESAGRTGLAKAENLGLILGRRNLSPDQAIYIGDTEGDQTAARQAGLRFVWAAYGFGRGLTGVDGQIEAVSELASLY